MKYFLLPILCVSFSALAQVRTYDGCYQLFLQGVKAPAICLSGTAEEGVGGANARLAVFETYTTKLKACLRSTSLAMDNSKLEFIIDGRKELVLYNFSYDGLFGDATAGTTQLKFIRLNERESQHLKDSAYRGDCL